MCIIVAILLRAFSIWCANAYKYKNKIQTNLCIETNYTHDDTAAATHITQKTTFAHALHNAADFAVNNYK